MVKAPNKAGKNLTQNMEFPNILMIQASQELTGGTERYPQAR